MTNANNFELGQGDNFIFALDVSASMNATDTPTGQSRIEYSKEKAKLFATEADKYDSDGADYYTFGQKVTPYLNRTVDQAKALIDGLHANEMATDTAGLIKAAWARAKEIKAAGNENNVVLMIVTDGAPSDGEAVKTAIRDIASQLNDRTDFGIVFLTVGVVDNNLRGFLADLDDNLNAKFDIVDVKAFEDVDFVQAFAGAISD